MSKNNVKWYTFYQLQLPSRILFFALPAFSRSSLLGKEEHNERPDVVMDGTVWMIGGDVKAGTAFFVATALSPRIIVTTSFLCSGFLQGVDKTAFVGPFETS